jgi:multidrug efflux pump subunit AcrA (membrane-fusion protein)
MFRLAEIGTLYVEVVLPVGAFGEVKPGMPVEVKPEIPRGTTHRGTVAVVDKVLDAASSTFGVRLELPNPQLKIPAGIHCTANFPGVSAPVVAKARSVRDMGLKPRASVTAPAK